MTLGSLSFGYAQSIIATTLGQPGFYSYFGLTADPTSSDYSYTNSIIGTANGLVSAGGLFGSILMAWLIDAKGRKFSLGTSAILALIGGALQAGSAHIGMFLAGRFITGFANGETVFR